MCVFVCLCCVCVCGGGGGEGVAFPVGCPGALLELRAARLDQLLLGIMGIINFV